MKVLINKLSIVLPVYNASKHLNDCLNSILTQEYYPMEIIIVNDGSTDGSGDLCKEFIKENSDNPNVEMKLIYQENQGSVSARKNGIKQASGEYITFLDADDYVLPGTYKKLMDSLMAQNADIIACGYVRCNKELDRIIQSDDFISKRCVTNGNDTGVYHGEDKEKLISNMHFSDFHNFTFGILPSMWSKVYKLSLLQRFHEKIPDGIRMGDDAAVTYSAILMADRIVVDNSICGYCYCDVVGSITHSYSAEYFSQISELYSYLKNTYNEYGDNRELMTQLEYYRAYLLIRGLDWLYDNNNSISLIDKIKMIKQMTSSCSIFDDLDKQINLELSDDYLLKIKEIQKKKWFCIWLKWQSPRIRYQLEKLVNLMINGV